MEAHKLGLSLNNPNSLPFSSPSSLLVEPISHSIAIKLSDSSILLFPPSPLSSLSPPTVIPPTSSSSTFLRLIRTSSLSHAHILFLSASSHNSFVLLHGWLLPFPSQKDSLFSQKDGFFNKKDSLLNKKDGIFNQKDGFFSKKESLLNQKDGFFSQKDSLLNQKDSFFSKKSLLDQKDGFFSQKDSLLNQKDSFFSKKDSLLDQKDVFFSQKDSFFSKKKRLFSPVKLVYKSVTSPSLVLDHRHGLYVSLAGSTNFFVLHVPAEERIFVYSASIGDLGEEEIEVKLLKCAVLECDLPVFSVGFSAGFLLTGEMAGIRVFSLRNLVQGKTGKKKKSQDSGKIDGKLRTVKLRQSSDDLGSYFVELSSSSLPLRAKSIHVLKQNRFLVLDSNGFIHLLHLNRNLNSDNSRECFSLVKLNCSIDVNMLAVYPDQSRGNIIWVSDGFYSVHVIKLDDDGERCEGDKLSGQVSAIRAIFMGGRMIDIAALSENDVLVLHDGGLFVYGITET